MSKQVLMDQNGGLLRSVIVLIDVVVANRPGDGSVDMNSCGVS